VALGNYNENETKFHYGDVLLLSKKTSLALNMESAKYSETYQYLTMQMRGVTSQTL
jgi:hypothetical protein